MKTIGHLTAAMTASSPSVVGLSYVLWALGGCLFLPQLLRAEEFNRVAHYSARMFSFGTLTVDTRIGDVQIEGWDEPLLQIEAEKIVRAKSEGKAEALYDQIKIRLEGADKKVLLRTDYPSRRLWRPFRDETRLSVNYRIRMPFDANLMLKCVDGDVRVRGIAGHEDLHVNYGDVEVQVPSIYRLRSLRARALLGYVESDLHGESGAGWGQKLTFWNARGDQDIVVHVRLGGVFIYGNPD